MFVLRNVVLDSRIQCMFNSSPSKKASSKLNLNIMISYEIMKTKMKIEQVTGGCDLFVGGQ